MLRVLVVAVSVGSALALGAGGASRGKNMSIYGDRIAAKSATQLHEMRLNATSQKGMPCQCQGSSSTWTRCVRTVPKCVFIDLGAANGNTFTSFLNNGYGPVANCPSGGQWEAFLVEANPHFKAPLEQTMARFPGAVKAFPSTAAYMCEGTTSFYLDTVTSDHNYWGSSMSSKHPDVVNSGKKKVTVNTVNLMRLLYEETIPGDYVMVKMDIEGAEYDIIPCLADSPSVALMDALYMESHDISFGLAGNSVEVWNKAKNTLKEHGVYMPAYNSPTMFLARK
jgi:FkbM family methyltransferase